jgi:hypothetical protein
MSFLSDWPGMLRHGEAEFSRKEAVAGDFFKPKGEMTMPYVLSASIFCLWCLPVAVFIILPLVMLAGWGIKKLVGKRTSPDLRGNRATATSRS